MPIPTIPAVHSPVDATIARVELRHALDGLDPAAIVVSDDSLDGCWYRVRLAIHGLDYLVRITGEDAPCSAIEAAIDAAIASGHKGVFHEAEYPEQGPDQSDEDWQAECERAEVDMHVVGHTSVPEGWGSWIPQWEITVENADEAWSAYGTAFMQGREVCEDDPHVDVNYDGTEMTDVQVCEYVMELAQEAGYEPGTVGFVGFLAGFSEAFCGGHLCAPFVPGQPTRLQRAQHELAEARMAALDSGAA